MKTPDYVRGFSEGVVEGRKREATRRAVGMIVQGLDGPELDRGLSDSDDLARLRVQLAGCLVAAEGGTSEPAQPGTYGWSPAYKAVLDLRHRYDALVESVRDAVQLLNDSLPF